MENTFFKSVRCLSKRDLHAVVLGNVDKALGDISISADKPAEVTVAFVDDPNGSQLRISILPAKDAIRLQSPSQKESGSVTENSDTNSAPPVEKMWFINPGASEVTLVSLSCTNCKKTAEHQAIKIIPERLDGDNSNPMERLQLAKRLTCCSNCGNMRLTT